MKTKNIAIFASGTGTNAINLHRYFRNNSQIKITKLLCNRPTAGVLDLFKETSVETIIIDKENFSNKEVLLKHLENVDFIVLAGFLWLIPDVLIDAFPGKIINLHPSLLPKFGGKGMYGMKVHEAVIRAQELYSGITIHLVNNEYDKGKILAQERCKIEKSDTPELLAKKIHELEQTHLPNVIENFIKSTTRQIET